MVDMFSLLVIFLLQTFSASPELLVIAKGVTLPVAGSAKELKDAPLLTLSSEGIHLDQKLVGTTEELLKNPEPLMQKLSDLRDLWQRTHPNEKFKGEINLQASKEIPSTTVSQVMGMLPSQAYGSIQLAVVSGGLK
jgi:biopolymer transport protein ExbD